MRKLIDMSNTDASQYFLKGSSYFNGDLPDYINFELILNDVSKILDGSKYFGYKKFNPEDFPGVNYSFVSNKDGRFSWRPYELLHPLLYVSLINLICQSENWKLLQSRFAEFEKGIVECCSLSVISIDNDSDNAVQVRSWWQKVEQRSISLSLEYSHLLHTDVTDCYGSLYTHSIAWAIHGLEEAKHRKNDRSLLGNSIDTHIRAGRYGQTNGISQGSSLMDFIAEIVLGYADLLIDADLGQPDDVKIIRYRDDYRIFANSDQRAEEVLKIVSDNLRKVGMKLGVAKTYLGKNVVEGSIKDDKLAGIDLQDLGETHARTIQKQLLRLHSFGRRFPNSGALRRLVSELHTRISRKTEVPEDLEVQVAIATDIAFVSPLTFPAIAGILSHMIALAPSQHEKQRLWTKVREKMKRVPYNGYLEVWMQRVVKPSAVGLLFESDEVICMIVNSKNEKLWENNWISDKNMIKAIDISKIVVEPKLSDKETIDPEEVELFTKNAWVY